MALVRPLAALADPVLIQALGAGRALILDDMLGAAAAGRIRKAALELDALGELRPAGVGREGTRAPAIRGDRIAWLDPVTPPEGLRPAVELLAATMAILNETAYVGATTLECQLAIYGAGDAYERHRDALRGTTVRRITAVYYANDWREGHGGELELFDEHDFRARVVAPVADRLVLFRSDLTAHAVRPVVEGPRVAISGFFRRDTPG